MLPLSCQFGYSLNQSGCMAGEAIRTPDIQLATCKHTDLTASTESITCGDSKGVINTVTTGSTKQCNLVIQAASRTGLTRPCTSVGACCAHTRSRKPRSRYSVTAGALAAVTARSSVACSRASNSLIARASVDRASPRRFQSGCVMVKVTSGSSS